MDKPKFKLIPLHGDIIPDVVDGLKEVTEIDIQIANLYADRDLIYQSIFQEIQKVHGDEIRNRSMAVDPTGHFILLHVEEDE